MRLPANKEVVINGVKGDAMELSLTIDLKESQAIEVNVLRSPGKEEFTRIIFYREKGFSDGLDYRSGEETARMPADLVPLVTGRPAEPYKRGTRASVITIDASSASILPDVQVRPPESAPLVIEKDELLNLRIFVDKSVVEVFANGKQCVAMRVYPGRNDSNGVSIRSIGKEASLQALEAWQMKSIY